MVVIHIATEEKEKADDVSIVVGHPLWHETHHRELDPGNRASISFAGRMAHATRANALAKYTVASDISLSMPRIEERNRKQSKVFDVDGWRKQNSESVCFRIRERGAFAESMKLSIVI